jgi:hypothetical protein
MLIACGGGVESAPIADPGEGGSAAAPGERQAPREDGSQGFVPFAPTPVPDCHPQREDFASGIASCDVARTSFIVDVMGLTWMDPSLAWRAGGRARFDVRYTNTSETRSIHYPGMLVAASDARARTDTEAHGDGVVHPDLYALAACTASMSRDHGFELLADLPSGTRLTFTMSPAVASVDAIDTCDGTLAQKTLTVTAP